MRHPSAFTALALIKRLFSGVTIAAMCKNPLLGATLVVALMAMIGGLAYLLPAVQRRVDWRLDIALTYLRGMAQPAGAFPTSLPHPQVAITHQPTPTHAALVKVEPTRMATPAPSATPTQIPTPIPKAVSLVPPKWEKQDANNCGPATLAMYLRNYGWEGDQFTISEMIKPIRGDRNVNVEELAYYVNNRAGWLKFEFRVGGDLEVLKKLMAAGIPVMIEEGTLLDQSYWPNDDRWAAHYLLLTSYDDERQIFTGQDSYYGADKQFTYKALDQSWQTFNRVYIMIYPAEMEPTIQPILGAQWDQDTNRRHALEVAQEETQKDPTNPFAWFNLGSNLTYFERYIEATDAFDRARQLGLPQRMLRYQFGPFMAYFHTGQLDDLEALLDYALQITRNSEEAFLWRGWMEYRRGNEGKAIENFQRALQENPVYEDAKYALRFVGAAP
jgi:tetratricopeptide (TPR) repeat protein